MAKNKWKKEEESCLNFETKKIKLQQMVEFDIFWSVRIFGTGGRCKWNQNFYCDQLILLWLFLFSLTPKRDFHFRKAAAIHQKSQINSTLIPSTCFSFCVFSEEFLSCFYWCGIIGSPILSNLINIVYFSWFWFAKKKN